MILRLYSSASRLVVSPSVVRSSSGAVASPCPTGMVGDPDRPVLGESGGGRKTFRLGDEGGE